MKRHVPLLLGLLLAVPVLGGPADTPEVGSREAITAATTEPPSGDKDPDGRSRQAAYNLILGALEGLRQR